MTQQRFILCLFQKITIRIVPIFADRRIEWREARVEPVLRASSTIAVPAVWQWSHHRSVCGIENELRSRADGTESADFQPVAVGLRVMIQNARFLPVQRIVQKIVEYRIIPDFNEGIYIAPIETCAKLRECQKGVFHGRKETMGGQGKAGNRASRIER